MNPITDNSGLISGPQPSRGGQAVRILHELASLPGGSEVNLVTRRFARMDPGEQFLPYQEVQRTFPVHELPSSLAIPEDADEILISLRGRLPRDDDSSLPEKGRDGLVHALDDVLSEGAAGRDWDLRAVFEEEPPAPAMGRPYEVRIFNNPGRGLLA